MEKNAADFKKGTGLIDLNLVDLAFFCFGLHCQVRDVSYETRLLLVFTNCGKIEKADKKGFVKKDKNEPGRYEIEPKSDDQ